MSKLSFRARALDANKALPVYHADELPDLSEFNAINRAVPEMPTGMEKEEETEHHLQRAMAAQQLYGEAQQLVIPTPDFKSAVTDYTEVYCNKQSQPRNYIRVHGYLMDGDYPDYDLDDEDIGWCQSQTGLTPLKLESMIETLEKGLGQQSQNLTLAEAQALLHGDDDNLVVTVFDYWQAKRARLKIPLIATVKQEKRDGTSSTDYYVAFRRRTEKMQTRKNRKNDEASYERMCKLRRDMERSCQLLNLIKQREQKKQSYIDSLKQIFCHRYKMRDWNCSAYNSIIHQLGHSAAVVPTHPSQVQNGQMMHAAYSRQLLQQQHSAYPGMVVPGMTIGQSSASTAAMQQQHQHTAAYHPLHPIASVGETSAAADVSMPWPQQPAAEGSDSKQSSKQKDRSKRKHHKKKHHTPTQPPVESVPVQPEEIVSEEDRIPAPHVENTEEESSGPFALKRRLHVQYCAPRGSLLTGLPFDGENDPDVELPSNKRYRLYLTSMGRAGPFLGMTRQRVGRGGRRCMDRGPWQYGGDSDFQHALQHGHIDVADVNLQDESRPYYQLDSPPPAKRIAYPPPPVQTNSLYRRDSFISNREFLSLEERKQFAHFPLTPVSSDEEDPAVSKQPTCDSRISTGGNTVACMTEELDNDVFREFGDVVTCVRLFSSTPADVVHRSLESDSGLDSDGVSPFSDTQVSRSSAAPSSAGKSSPGLSGISVSSSATTTATAVALQEAEDEGLDAVDANLTLMNSVSSQKVVGVSDNTGVFTHIPSVSVSNGESAGPTAVSASNVHLANMPAVKSTGVQQDEQPMPMYAQTTQTLNAVGSSTNSGSGSKWHAAAGPGPSVGVVSTPANATSTTAQSSDAGAGGSAGPGVLNRQRVNQSLSGHRHSNNQSPIHNALRVL